MKSKHGFETSLERSKLMSRIKATNTRAEIKLRKALWAAGFRYRINVRTLPGTPDIVNKQLRIVIFVDGEFWHGFKWKEKKGRLKSNREYWIKKIEGNIVRDRRNRRKLRELGYTVIKFWEHEIKGDLQKCVTKVVSACVIQNGGSHAD